MDQPNDKFTWRDGDLEFGDEVDKFNPHHDERGRFAEGDNNATLEAKYPGVVDAIGSYASYGSSINGYLRHGLWTNIPPAEKANSGKYVEALDKAIAGEKLSEPVILYRGVGPTLANELTGRVGGSFSDKAFVSTSKLAETAAGFAEQRAAGGMVLKIAVPKGANALDISNVETEMYGVHEVLLPRETVFAVDGPPRFENKVMTIPVRVVGQYRHALPGQKQLKEMLRA